MKKLLLLLISTAIFYPTQFSSFAQKSAIAYPDFKLHYMNVGFGSNRFKMQPVFVVNDKHFIYTMETVWVLPDQTNIPRDTLLTGKFRDSSVDSIINLVHSTADSAINRSANVLSGSATYISVETGRKKLTFNLYNTSDSTAENILNILSTYIPKEINNLYISKYED